MTCRKGFPHLVEMHKKYAKDGLVAISVDLDDPNVKERREKVLKFLNEKKASLTNLMLSEDSEVWQKKLEFLGPPVVRIYDRDGKRVKNYDDGVDFDEVEKVIRGLLKK